MITSLVVGAGQELPRFVDSHTNAMNNKKHLTDTDDRNFSFVQVSDCCPHRLGQALELQMASSQSNGVPNGVRTPFQDLTNSDNSGQRADPKELKRQRARERYALNKDEINRKRRETRAVKKPSAILNENQAPTNIPLSITPTQSGFNPMCNATGQSAVTQIRCAQPMEGITTVAVPSGGTTFQGQDSFPLNWSGFANKENYYYGIGSSQRLQTTPRGLLSSSADKQAQRRERENLRYDKNKEFVLQRLRETRNQHKNTPVLTSVEHTQANTPVSNIFPIGLDSGLMPTGEESAVIQLQHTSTVQGISMAGIQSRASPFDQPNETTGDNEDSDWLHRNDTYQMQQIGGRLRPVSIPSRTPNGNTPMENYIGNDHGEDPYGIQEPNSNTVYFDATLCSV